MFARGIKSCHHSVALGAGVWGLFLVLPFVVLKDEPLLAFLDTLPVCHERGVE